MPEKLPNDRQHEHELYPQSWFELFVSSAETTLYMRARNNLERFVTHEAQDLELFQTMDETKFLVAARAKDILTLTQVHGDERRNRQGKGKISAGQHSYIRYFTDSNKLLWLGLYDAPPGKGTLIPINATLPLSPHNVLPESLRATDSRSHTPEIYKAAEEAGHDVQLRYISVVQELTKMLLEATALNTEPVQSAA